MNKMMTLDPADLLTSKLLPSVYLWVGHKETLYWHRSGIATGLWLFCYVPQRGMYSTSLTVAVHKPISRYVLSGAHAGAQLKCYISSIDIWALLTELLRRLVGSSSPLCRLQFHDLFPSLPQHFYPALFNASLKTEVSFHAKYYFTNDQWKTILNRHFGH